MERTTTARKDLELETDEKVVRFSIDTKYALTGKQNLSYLFDSLLRQQ